MEYDRRHHAYKPSMGGRSVPDDCVINDLKEAAINYVGTYSEYNPIGLRDNIFLVVRKPLSIIPKRDFKLYGFQLSGGQHTCGGNITVNESVSLSKQDLLRIANEMDSDDILLISYVAGKWGGIKDINKVTKEIKIVTNKV